MWHKPQLMNTLADLLLMIGGAALFSGIVLALSTRFPLPPVRTLVFKEPLAHIQRTEIQQAVRGQLGKDFLRLDIDRVRRVLESLPWVRRAEVRRVWPTQLEISIEEHVPVARWGQDSNELVNSHGEVFFASLPNTGEVALPLLHGPAGTSKKVLKRFADSSRTLAQIAQKPAQLVLSPRLSWEMQLENGLSIKFAREDGDASKTLEHLNFDTLLARFVEVYPQLIANRQAQPQVVDLRYPNGLVLSGNLK